MKELSRRLGIEPGQPDSGTEISVELERVGTKRSQDCNVDFYRPAAAYMGIPAGACSRASLTQEHAAGAPALLEQMGRHKISGPPDNYTGPDERSYLPSTDDDQAVSLYSRTGCARCQAIMAHAWRWNVIKHSPEVRRLSWN